MKLKLVKPYGGYTYVTDNRNMYYDFLRLRVKSIYFQLITWTRNISCNTNTNVTLHLVVTSVDLSPNNKAFQFSSGNE